MGMTNTELALYMLKLKELKVDKPLTKAKYQIG